LAMLMPERYREAHQRGLERLRITGEPRLFGKILELRGLRKDGGEFPVELSLAMWMTAEGRFYSGIIRDITARKQAEDALRASEERYRLLFERNLAGTFHSLRDGRMLECNDAFVTLLGYPSRDAVLAHNARDFYCDPADREQLLERLRPGLVITNYEIQLR